MGSDYTSIEAKFNVNNIIILNLIYYFITQFRTFDNIPLHIKTNFVFYK